MNQIKQHRPAFFEGWENEVVDFESKDDLLAIPFVSNFATQPGFHQFSFGNNLLMAEYQEGRKWWVVGYLKEPVAGLSEWVPVE